MSETYTAKQFSYLSNFTCDSNICMQNCCELYPIIYVENYLVEHYEKNMPDFIENIKKDGNEYLINMNDKNKCPWHKDSMCLIHKDYGDMYQSETCYFYPRIVSLFNNELFVNSSFVCAPMIYSSLITDNPFAIETTTLNRIPSKLTDYSKENFNGIDINKLLIIFDAFMSIANDANFNNEENIVRMIMLSKDLDKIPKTDWYMWTKSALPTLDRGSLNKFWSKIDNITHYEHNTMKYIHLVLTATKNYRLEPFTELMYSIITFFNERNFKDCISILHQRNKHKGLDHLLKHYIKSQLAIKLFPMKTWGNCIDDIILLMIKYMTLKLALLIDPVKYNDYTDYENLSKKIYLIEKSFYHREDVTYRYYIEEDWYKPEKIASFIAPLDFS